LFASNSSIGRERRLLQAAVALLALIPIGAGLSGIWLGPAMVRVADAGVTADSQFRYLSGLLLAIGLCFWRMVPIIERAGPAARLLTLVVFIGGIGRLVSLIALGVPSLAMLGGLAMELVVTPLLCFWQMRIARGYR
jgi:uncharacterized protein DUF4345